VARVERAPGRTRQQRRVEHEVRVVDKRDASPTGSGERLQCLGGIEAAKATADDQDLSGHTLKVALKSR
jgi:hypothetical protein